MGVVAIVLGLASTARADNMMVGKTIATQGTAKGVAACISCHGAKGEGNAAAGFPRLAGINAAYLSEQLSAFANGERKSTIMQPFAKLLSSNGRSAVALYFSSLPPPAGIKAGDSTAITPSDTGAWIATRGRWDQGLPACAQCHGPGGIGVGTAFPPLAGQPAAYIESQLHGWKMGARPPGPMALMPVVVSKLSDTDISAVAVYYAGNVGSSNNAAPAGSKQ
nr:MULTISPECIES: c-type cytochrome [unclassified Caballeronia]